MSELAASAEAILFASPEPVELSRLAEALGELPQQVETALQELGARYAAEDCGIELKSVAGGWRLMTKPQHHEAVRQFIRSLKPPLRLSLPALETLAVIAYRQPVTAPEIREIRGVDASGVLNTLLDKKLITTAGRKDVVGKPILYRTTREFLLRFGLGSLSDLPTMKEFEEMLQAGMEGLPPAAGGEETEAVAADAATESESPQSAEKDIDVPGSAEMTSAASGGGDNGKPE